MFGIICKHVYACSKYNITMHHMVPLLGVIPQEELEIIRYKGVVKPSVVVHVVCKPTARGKVGSEIGDHSSFAHEMVFHIAADAPMFIFFARHRIFYDVPRSNDKLDGTVRRLFRVAKPCEMCICYYLTILIPPSPS